MLQLFYCFALSIVLYIGNLHQLSGVAMVTKKKLLRKNEDNKEAVQTFKSDCEDFQNIGTKTCQKIICPGPMCQRSSQIQL